MKEIKKNNSLDLIAVISITAISFYLCFFISSTKLTHDTNLKTEKNYIFVCTQEMEQVVEKQYSYFIKKHSNKKISIATSLSKNYCQCLVDEFKAKDQRSESIVISDSHINQFLNDEKNEPILEKCAKKSEESVGLSGEPKTRFINSCVSETFQGVLSQVMRTNNDIPQEREDKILNFATDYCECVFKNFNSPNLDEDSLMDKMVEIYKSEQGQEQAKKCAISAKNNNLND